MWRTFSKIKISTKICKQSTTNKKLNQEMLTKFCSYLFKKNTKGRKLTELPTVVKQNFFVDIIGEKLVKTKQCTPNWNNVKFFWILIFGKNLMRKISIKWKILKIMSEDLLQSISNFHKFWPPCLAIVDENYFPDLLTKATIFPFYKTGSKHKPSFYRTFSLLPVISKNIRKNHSFWD